VGVGTTTISDKLHVSSTSTRIRIESTNNSSNTGLVLIAKNSSGTSQSGGVYIQSGSSESYVSLSGDNSTYHLNVTNNGNVGIGTTSPGQKLDVVGAIKSQQPLYPQLILTETTANTNALMFYDAGASTKAIRFRVSDATDKLSIDANGEVYINTLTDAGDYKLQVSGNAYVTGTTVLAATSGRVGIGTTNPLVTMDIVSSGLAAARIKGGASTNQGGVFAVQEAGSTNTLVGIGDRASLLGGTPDQLASIYTSSGKPLVFDIGNGEKLRMHSNGGLKFVGQSAAPTAEAGTVYYDTDDNKLKVYNGTTWVDLH
jgi:hypothetical protein